MNEYKLPKQFMDEFASTGMVGTMFGFRLDELSQDELLAVINWSQQEITKMRVQHSTDLDLFTDKPFNEHWGKPPK